MCPKSTSRRNLCVHCYIMSTPLQCLRAIAFSLLWIVQLFLFMLLNVIKILRNLSSPFTNFPVSQLIYACNQHTVQHICTTLALNLTAVFTTTDLPPAQCCNFMVTFLVFDSTQTWWDPSMLPVTTAFSVSVGIITSQQMTYLNSRLPWKSILQQ